MSRRTRCASCAEDVLVTSASPVVRPEGVVLLCGDCRARPSQPSAPRGEAPAGEARSEAPKGEASKGDELGIEYEIEYEFEVEDDEAIRSADGNVVHGTAFASASGVLEPQGKDRRRRDPTAPAVIVADDD